MPMNISIQVTHSAAGHNVSCGKYIFKLKVQMKSRLLTINPFTNLWSFEKNLPI